LPEVLHEGEHHGGVCGCHHGLPADHAAYSAEVAREGEAQLHFAGFATFYAKVEGLHPRGEVFGEGGLECLYVHATQDSKTAALNSRWLLHRAHAIHGCDSDRFQIRAL
jgi:hypothetical protein